MSASYYAMPQCSNTLSVGALCQGGCNYDSNLNNCLYNGFQQGDIYRVVAKGSFNEEGGCTDCPTGRYGRKVGLSSADKCTKCAAGRFGTSVGRSTQCQLCSPGFSSNNEVGLTKCYPCAVGKYSDQDTRPACDPCPIGSYGDENESTDKLCKACEKGRYSDETGNTEFSDCKFCKAGRWTNIERRISSLQCAACRAGRYGTEEGCIAEQGTAEDPTAEYNQRDDKGTWSCIHSCKGCPLGRYSLVEGANSDTSCQVCPEGRYGDQQGLNSANLCKACPHGRWGGDSGMISARSLEVPKNKRCAACPLGKFNNVLGVTSSDLCKNCPKGQYLDTTNDEAVSFNLNVNSCKLCPAGRWSSTTGLIAQDSRWNVGPTPSSASNEEFSCLGCPAGMYFDEEGATQEVRLFLFLFHDAFFFSHNFFFLIFSPLFHAYLDTM